MTKFVDMKPLVDVPLDDVFTFLDVTHSLAGFPLPGDYVRGKLAQQDGSLEVQPARHIGRRDQPMRAFVPRDAECCILGHLDAPRHGEKSDATNTPTV